MNRIAVDASSPVFLDRLWTLESVYLAREPAPAATDRVRFVKPPVQLLKPGADVTWTGKIPSSLWEPRGDSRYTRIEGDKPSQGDE